MIDLNVIADKLLDMKPDPIPEFILLKEFKGLSPDSREYQNAYDKVCNHPFVKSIESEQNDRGFWPPFHGRTEDLIKRCLSIGLERDHHCLRKVSHACLTEDCFSRIVNLILPGFMFSFTPKYWLCIFLLYLITVLLAEQTGIAKIQLREIHV